MAAYPSRSACSTIVAQSQAGQPSVEKAIGRRPLVGRFPAASSEWTAGAPRPAAADAANVRRNLRRGVCAIASSWRVYACEMKSDKAAYTRDEMEPRRRRSRRAGWIAVLAYGVVLGTSPLLHHD